MTRQESSILEELVDTIEQLEQRLGSSSQRCNLSSSLGLRKEVREFADNCRAGRLTGRARRRQANELFRKIISRYPTG
mgnify:CR=1 FL=1